MRKLFVLNCNGGDGSFTPHFTFNECWVEKLNKQYNTDSYDFPECYSDGDGFHYKTLTVPNECTLKSLNISYDCSED